MPSFDFIQAGYQTRGLVADSQAWINLYIEKTESGVGANHNTGYAAYCTPGKQILCQLSDQPVSCVVPSNAAFYSATTDLFFVMSGATLYAIRATFSAGAWTGTSAVIGTGFPTQAIAGTGGQLFPTTIIVISPTQLFVLAVGNPYVAAYGSAISTSAIGDAGSGYAVNDTGTVIVSSGIPAQYIITSVGGSGDVTGYTITYTGTGYSVINGVATNTGGVQPGTGSGFTINVTAVAAAAWLVQQQQIPDQSGLNTNYVNSATWMDGYTIVSMAPNDPDPQRRQFFISGLNDPTSWNVLDFDTKEANSDPVIAVYAAAEILGIFGSQTVELYQDTGNVLSAFQRLPGGGVLEEGLSQPHAICKVDNTNGAVAFLASNARGQYEARLLSGSSSLRISNHALENTWSNYDTAGMSMYSYTENGHNFVMFHFPIPDKTWGYDATIGPALGWHERRYWDGAAWHADLGRYHGFFPEIGHCVGDYQNGNLYLQSLQFLQDNCQNIRRIRIAPHLVNEKRRNIYDRVRLHALTGIVPATGAGSNPVCSIRISNDGGQNFGSYLTVPMGTAGQTKLDINWFHLGYARDRVFWWECDEPIDIVLVDMYADYRLGFN